MIDSEKVLSLTDIRNFATEVVKDLEERIIATSSSTAVLCLHGDLGAGKTTFVQQVATALTVEDVIISPTFVLMKIYDTKHTTFKRLVHIDAYRLTENENATLEMLVEEINQPNTLTCIEWPEVCRSFLEEYNFITSAIFFSADTNDSRVVKYHPYE